MKTVPLDRIIGVSTDETYSGIPLNKEIQHRDERIEVLQAEIEQLRKTQTELAKQVERLIIKLFDSNQFRFFFKTAGKNSSFSSFMAEDDMKGQVRMDLIYSFKKSCF